MKNKHLSSYPKHLIKQHVLYDGSIITIRPIHQNDPGLIKEFGHHLSNELKHFNYMENFKELPENIIRKLIEVDYNKSMTFIASYNDHQNETVAGMVYYISEDGENCDFDMIVADAWQNKGIGSVLTETFIQTAKENGMKAVKIMILASNIGGLSLAKHYGFQIIESDDPTVKIVMKKL